MRKRTILIIVVLILLALVMRTPLTAVGPLVSFISTDYALSTTTAGLITTIPLIVFALTSNPIAWLSAKWGTRTTLFMSALVLMVAIALRSVPGTLPFFVGTVFIGLGISGINVLLPVLIKEELPLRIGILTALYTTVMEAGSIVATSAAVPAANVIGWQGSLAVWTAPAIAACIAAWLLDRLPSVGFANRIDTEPYVDNITFDRPDEKNGAKQPFLRIPAGRWLVTYMALQTLLFYCMVAWLPLLMTGKGMSPEGAGYMAAYFQFLNIPGSLITPVLAEKLKDQKLLGILTGALYAVGLGIILASSSTILLGIGTTLIALCAGASISLALALIGIRTRSSRDANELSGTVQAWGYGLAALGPFAMGYLLDVSGGWTIPVLALIVVSIALAFAGRFAGEAGFIR